MYIIFEGVTYNIKNFKHPGGYRLLECANTLDVTELIKSNHTIHSIELLKKLPKLKISNNNFIFSEEYNTIKEFVYTQNKKWESFDKYDIIMWISLFSYLILNHFSTDIFFSSILLIIIGSYGHQYVHSSSDKASMLTFSGFISNHWRQEHVFNHHPYTNTVNDIDFTEFNKINKILKYIPSILKFIIVTLIIVIRPVVQSLNISYIKKATFFDRLVILYNFYDIYTNSINYFIKHLILAVWFLIINYFNHYTTGLTDVKTEQLDWYENQLNTTQNFVFNSYLYKNYPFIHSLLTFGLDRQVEHHIFPRIKMEHLSKITPFLDSKKIKIHYFGFKSIKQIWNNFV
jgi:hypothetical protein